MKTILVPTDFSECAENALQLAYQIAQKSGAKIILSHIVEPIQSYVGASEGMYIDLDVENKYLNYLTENAQEKMQAIAQKPNLAGVEIQTLVRVGGMFSITQMQIKENNIDLLVMGTQGASGVDEVLVGSNAERVVRFADCPVLTVDKSAKSQAIQKIVVASDLQTTHLACFAIVKELQALFNAQILVLLVNTPHNFRSQREIDSAKTEFLKEVGFENCSFYTYAEHNLEAGVLAFAEENQADLIALATHQRSGVSHLINGSVAENLVNHSNIPVLTFGLKKSVKELAMS